MQDYPNSVDFVVVCSVCRREAGSNFSTLIAQSTAHTALSTLEKHKCTLDTKQHKQTPLTAYDSDKPLSTITAKEECGRGVPAKPLTKTSWLANMWLSKLQL